LPIIDRVAGALRAACREIVLVANDRNAGSWLPGARVLPDVHAGAGGLAGVERGLLTGGDIVAIAWDMPFVSDALVRTLIAEARARDADVVIPQSDSPHGFEPFCAFYSSRVLATLSRFLDAGGGAAHTFIGTLPRATLLPARDVAALGDARRLFFSVNTRDDLERARAMASTTE
jgi:molybdopterin-guanine dinucleotide biosynthesis protein A